MADLCYDDDDNEKQDEPEREATPLKKRQRRYNSQACSGEGTVVRVSMPLTAPEALQPGSSVEEVQITLLDVAKMQIWINVDHLPWLCSYLHDQYVLGGVPLIDRRGCGDDATPPASSGPCTPWTDMTYDFGKSVFVAKVKNRDGRLVERRVSVLERMATPGDSCHSLSKLDAKALFEHEMTAWLWEAPES